MALIVIVCGILLMLGGGASLLMGFDIVMTERGSAMTLGGVVALSGGLMSVGIGLALQRLSRILRALEGRSGKPGRTLMTLDRPVVPPPSSAPELYEEASRSAPAALAGVSRRESSQGASVAAAASAAGPMAESRSIQPYQGFADRGGYRDPDLSEEDSAPRLEDALGSPPPAIGELTGQPHQQAPMLEPEAQRTAIQAAEAVLPDLEEELARALAEADPPPMHDLEERLAGMQDVAEAIAIREEPGPEGDSPALDAPGETDPSWMKPPTVEVEEVAGEADQFEVSESGEAPIESATPDTSADDPIDPEFRDLMAAPTPIPEPDVDRIAATISEGVDAEPPQEEAPMEVEAVDSGRIVLGTYNVGGRTYRMFADGSVEAITENGVERFLSMDELRKHLSNT